MTAPPLAPRRDVAYLVVLASAGAQAPGTTYEPTSSLTISERLALARTAAGSFDASFGHGGRAPVPLARGQIRTLTSDALKLLFWHGPSDHPEFFDALVHHGLRAEILGECLSSAV